MEKKSIIDLCSRYMADSLSEDELQTLVGYLSDPADAESFREALHVAVFTRNYPALKDKEQPDLVFQRILSSIRDGAGHDLPAIPGIRRIFSRVRIAAAAVLLLFIAGIYLFVRHYPANDLAGKQQNSPQIDIAAPSSSNATITLASGARIGLDSAKNGALATEGNVKLVKKADGQIAYAGAETGLSPLQYNTLNVPRGSRFVHLTLSDGTGVWLNAGSSLRYPTAFTTTERRVEMTGEAYFEVAHENTKPFIVAKTSDNTEVRVLGTHFNINAYDDEDRKKITLLEGSVIVSKGSASAKLSPGWQAQLTAEDEIKLIHNADTSAAIAWKNNLFAFHDADIKDIMRQLSRWYDIDVSYQGEPSSRKFSGEIGRNLSLRDLLDGLAFTSIHFEIRGNRQVIISP